LGIKRPPAHALIRCSCISNRPGKGKLTGFARTDGRTVVDYRVQTETVSLVKSSSTGGRHGEERACQGEADSDLDQGMSVHLETQYPVAMAAARLGRHCREYCRRATALLGG